MELCPLCNNQLTESVKDRHNPLMFHNKCLTCGEYTINQPAIDGLNSVDYAKKKYIISGFTREATENSKHIEILSENYKEIIDSAPYPKDPFEAIDKIFLYIYKYSTEHSFSDFLKLNPTTYYPIAYSKTPMEFKFILGKAVQLGYLETTGDVKYVLGTEGWKRIDKIKYTIRITNKAFVAMWFDKMMLTAWSDGFQKALKTTGYDPVRIDLLPHNDKIDDQIIKEIRRSSLLVADFTGNRGGV